MSRQDHHDPLTLDPSLERDRLLSELDDVQRRGLAEFELEVRHLVDDHRQVVREEAIRALAAGVRSTGFRRECELIWRRTDDEELAKVALSSWLAYSLGADDGDLLSELADLACNTERRADLRSVAFCGIERVARQKLTRQTADTARRLFSPRNVASEEVIRVEITNMKTRWSSGEKSTAEPMNREPLQVFEDTKRAEVDGHGLTNLPPALFALADLEELTVRSFAGPLPTRLAEFKALRRLTIVYPSGETTAHRRELPHNLGDLVRLETLQIIGGGLRSIPRSIGALRSLKKLLLKQNNLPAVPEELGGCQQLDTIVLEGNDLATLPASLAELPELRLINLRSNRLVTVPPALIGAAALVDLDLADNQLATLPNDLAGWGNLRRLDLGGNKLSDPSSLVKLRSLRRLDLSHNRLDRLPPEFLALPDLKYLDLEGNPDMKLNRPQETTGHIALVRMPS